MPWIEEFLFVGREGGATAWHVRLGARISDGFGGETVSLTQPLTPEQAALDYGMSLEDAIDGLNTQALSDLAAKTAQVAALEASLAAASAQVAALQEQLTTLASAE